MLVQHSDFTEALWIVLENHFRARLRPGNGLTGRLRLLFDFSGRSTEIIVCMTLISLHSRTIESLRS